MHASSVITGKALTATAAAIAVTMLAASPAVSQPISGPTLAPSTPAPLTTPEGTPATAGDTVTFSNPPIGRTAPGIDSAHAVNPAPGVAGPYQGHGQTAFYDVQARIDRVEQRVKAQLTGARQRLALAKVKSIRAEVATQKARHGGQLRDWDRENLNHRLDQLEAQVGLVQPAQTE